MILAKARDKLKGERKFGVNKAMCAYEASFLLGRKVERRGINMKMLYEDVRVGYQMK